MTVVYPRRLHGATLKVPLDVSIERDEDGIFIASEPCFHMHGQAGTPDEAVRDLLEVLVGYRESLAEQRDRLGEQLRQQLTYLMTLIDLG